MCSLTDSTEIVMTDVKQAEVFEDLLATVKGHKKTSDTDMARYRREFPWKQQRMAQFREEEQIKEEGKTIFEN